MTVLRHPNNNGVTLSQWRKTAAGGETSLSGTDDFSAGLAYTVGAEQVFVNGVLIERGVDYAATTGTTITGLTALVAGDIVTVSSPSAFNVANAIPKAAITAKGDLLVGTGASTPTNLTVGADGSTLVANSSASTGVSWAGPTFTAGKNKIINGDFYVNQRGFTSTTSSLTYTFDRWQTATSGGTATYSAKTFTTDAPLIAGYESKNFTRIVTSGQSGSTNFTGFQQKIEDVRTLAGQTATISFWAKAASGIPRISIVTEQSFGTGGSPSSVVTTLVGEVTLSTSWVRYSVTGTVPSISGKTIGSAGDSALLIELYVSVGTGLTADGTQGLQSNTFDIWGVQTEAGSVATAFQTATGTLQGELAACQRYYWRSANGTAYGLYGIGSSNSTTVATILVNFPVQLRTQPASVDYSTLGITDNVNYQLAASAVSVVASSTLTATLQVTTAASQTQYRPANLTNQNNTAGYLGFSAEL